MADPLDDDVVVALKLHNDGRADLSVASNVSDEALANYLRELAGFVETGQHRVECEACATGAPHEHHGTSTPEE